MGSENSYLHQNAEPRLPAQGAKRGRFIGGLMLVMAALYPAFLVLAAYAPEVLIEGASSPAIWGAGLTLLLVTFTLATLHFKRASRDFEQLSAEFIAPAPMQASTQQDKWQS